MSELRVGTLSDAAGTGPATLTGQYAAKAWVNFNGTGTVAIRESGNVSSITDNGTGAYTVSLTSAMSNADYSVAGMTVRSSTLGNGIQIATSAAPTATTIKFECVRSSDGVLGDRSIVCVHFHGDLA